VLINDIAALIQPGDSAIFAMISTDDPDAVAQQFEAYGGTVLRSSLNTAQIAALEEYLDKHSKASEP